MQISELRCTACNGTLKVDENNPNRAVCEYCRAEYMIEWSHPRADGGQPSLQLVQDRIEYTPVERPEPRRTGWEPYGWKRGLVLVIAFFVILGIWYGPAVYRRYQSDKAAKAGNTELVPHGAEAGKNGKTAGAAGKDVSGAGKAGAVDISVPSGLLADMAEQAFQKPIEEISEAELAKIQWIETKSTIETNDIGWSFENPRENPEAALTWVSFPRDSSNISMETIGAFKGLKCLGTSASLKTDSLKGLPLEKVEIRCDSLKAAANLLPEPENIKEIELLSSDISLEGMSEFANLEALSVDCQNLAETKELVNAKNLKKLSIDVYEGQFNPADLSVMTWLEDLTVISKNVRDLGFISNMKGLKALSVEDGTFLTLDPLKDRPELTKLSLMSCDEVKDMSPVGSLTGLTDLALDLPYDCQEPDLSGLSAVTRLYLSGFSQTGFLTSMPNLETLILDGCTVSSDGDFDGLTNLKHLTCTAFGHSEKSYSFITRLSALETLKMSGMITYDDISGIFNLPSLKELNIDGMQCEINFDNIEENTTLEKFSMDGIKLYNNVSVSGGGGITYVDWDDVNVAENIGFVTKLKGVKELSLRENELTDISFASSLEALQSLDIGENYVTDLTPLAGLKALRYVNCQDNPISNNRVLSENVMVVE